MLVKKESQKNNQWVKVFADELDDLNSSPGTNIEERENQSLQVVF